MNAKDPRTRLQTAGFAALAQNIQPLAAAVLPSEAFRRRMKLRLLKLETSVSRRLTTRRAA